MLILLRVRLPITTKKSAKAMLPWPLKLGRAHPNPTVDLETKPAVVPEFIQFRLKIGETEILADLQSHWKLDRFGQ
jgi:hypothetical protein